jgi:phosphatidylglycerophosphate synthase
VRGVEEQARPIGRWRKSHAPEAARSATIFVPRPSVAEREGAPGGLALLDRLLKQMRTLEIRDVTLLIPEGDPVPAVVASLFVPRIVRVPAVTSDLWGALAAAGDEIAPAGLALAADRLVDLRVLRALVGCAGTTVVGIDGGHPEQVAWVEARDVARAGVDVAVRAARLPLAAIDPYSPELRGAATPYAFGVSTAADRERAWRVLFDAVQKRALDLPGRYFDTPFENFLVRRFAPTDVTPNQITLATLVLAAVVATLFAHGWLRVGVLLALVVGVLDGVDGKLARMKLATSKVGELEHVGDFLYENAWYLSLAAWFAFATGSVAFWYAGVALVACDLADSLLYLAAQKRTGKMLDEVTVFDRRFRAIAGRRNVYVMIFVGGFFAGDAATAFLLAVAWAATTVGVHALRVAAIVRAPRSA